MARGVTLLELMLGVMIAGVLAAIALSSYSKYLAQNDIQRAISDIGMIQAAVAIYAVDNQGLPNSLAQVGAYYGNMKDPWGNAYQYLSHDDPKGKFRKDKNIHPINSDFDLYSMGKDGVSNAPLTAQASRDDIVRANNGRFVGLASDYDP
jgi:general secretion pathway protein G